MQNIAHNWVYLVSNILFRPLTIYKIFYLTMLDHYLRKNKALLKTPQTIAWSKSTIEPLKKGVKYVQSLQ